MSIQGTANAMDFAGLAALRGESNRNDPEVLREVARQFESLFTNMMLRNMRAASFGDPLMGGSEQDTYHEMFDQQIAVEMSRGRGLGIADMLVRQLSGTVSSAMQNEPLARASSGAELSRAAAVSRSVDEHSAPAEFARKLWPHARAAASELGIDPRVIVAQAALETGWGRGMPRSVDGSPSNNLFGIKADSRWSGDRVAADTMEFDGRALRKERASFRAYSSLAQGVQDYVKFLKDNPRYREALAAGTSPEGFAQGLQEAGYATDPEYASKILSILNGGMLDGLTTRLKNSGSPPITIAEASGSPRLRGVSDSTGA